MVFLQGLISESGVAVRCFELFENGLIKLFVSEEILAEIQDVITRPKLQAKYSRLTNERAENLIEVLRTKATLIKNVPQTRPLKVIEPVEFLNIVEEKAKMDLAVKL